MVVTEGMALSPPRPSAGTVATFIISIDPPDGPRRRSAAAQMKAIGWPFAMVEGCVASDEQIDALYSAPLNRWRTKRPLALGEVAIYASHRRALRTFLDSDAKHGLILEDDFGFVEPERFAARIEALLSTSIAWDVIKLFDFQPRGVARRRPAGDIHIVHYVSPTAGMVGYLVSREGAGKLLSRQSVFRQIDEDTKYYWELDLRVYSTEPNLVREISADLGGSLIETERQRIRCDRSLGRSLKGLVVSANRKLRHKWHHSRFGFREK